jgi:alpha-beta hydrolase superfamily lysophospholipase
MLFSYNDGLSVNDEDTLFTKHADRLLRLLMEKRKDDPTRPLVFICHDVGGLIVKEVSIQRHICFLTG